MKAMRRMNLMLGALMSLSCMHGCASIQTAELIKCGEPAAPSSYRIYLYVSREHAPNEKVAQALEYGANISLLKLNYDVTVLKKDEAAGGDGMLLKIDIVSLQHEINSKKMGIQFMLINNANNEVMHYKYEETPAFVVYGIVATKMGRIVARDVDEFLKCIRGRGNVRS